jgi:hypothetical protein
MKTIIIGTILWGIALLFVCLIGYMSKKRNDALDEAFKEAFGEKENFDNINVGSYNDYLTK